MNRHHFRTIIDLDDLSIRHIINFLTVKDVKKLSISSKDLHHHLTRMYVVSLQFPLDETYVADKKPVLEIRTNGVTDKNCETNTKKQIGKINISQLKELCLECPDEESEDCVIACSDYHQRILYNIYHGHWKRGTRCNIHRLRVTVEGRVIRLVQVLTAMPVLSHLEIHFPINVYDSTSLMKAICSHPTIITLTVNILTVLDKPNGYRDDLTTNFISPGLREITVSGSRQLRIDDMKLPNLERFTYLPLQEEEVDKLINDGYETDKPLDLSGARKLPRLPYMMKLIYEGCPNVKFYNDVFVGDTKKDICVDDWVICVAKRIKNQMCIM